MSKQHRLKFEGRLGKEENSLKTGLLPTGSYSLMGNLEFKGTYRH